VALPLRAATPKTFETPDAAAAALIDALGTQKADATKLATLFGSDWQAVLPTEGVDRTDVDAFLRQYKQRHSFDTSQANKALLSVGDTGWTLPIPLVKDAKGWHFDTRAGAEEMRVRRIGRNEISAAEAARAYHDAQIDYAEMDRDDDGVLEYAQKFVSTDGLHDGLYWSDDDSGEISPLGPLFGDSTPKGEWQGYRFRILEAQGPSAPGGAYSYLLGKNMSRGFALIAWPAKYGDTGVMSFMISQDGEVFEKDMGPKSDSLARAMKSFDPDDSWHEETESATAAQ
jgi:hypothetical protein